LPENPYLTKPFVNPRQGFSALKTLETLDKPLA